MLDNVVGETRLEGFLEEFLGGFLEGNQIGICKEFHKKLLKYSWPRDQGARAGRSGDQGRGDHLGRITDRPN